MITGVTGGYGRCGRLRAVTVVYGRYRAVTGGYGRSKKTRPPVDTGGYGRSKKNTAAGGYGRLRAVKWPIKGHIPVLIMAIYVYCLFVSNMNCLVISLR